MHYVQIVHDTATSIGTCRVVVVYQTRGRKIGVEPTFNRRSTEANYMYNIAFSVSTLCLKAQTYMNNPSLGHIMSEVINTASLLYA
jgi:hypothetical protein